VPKRTPRQQQLRTLLDGARSPEALDTLTTVLLAVVVEGGVEALDTETLAMALAHAGLRADMTAPELTRGIIDFISRHPPDPQLLAQLKERVD
jgi:hypothetical protein